MPTDEEGTSEPRAPGLRQALGGLGVWLGRASRATNAGIVVRLCKYVFLISCVALTLTIVYDAYSFYVARRDIDSELRSKKVSSLEYLGVLSQRKRALAITALEGRCMERTQLTMFRIFDAQQEEIKAAYGTMMKTKDQIVKLVRDSGPGLIDVDKAVHFIDLQGFTLAEFDQYVEPINPKGDLFEKWYRRHHAAERITRANIADDGTRPAVSELQVDDGKSYPLALDAGELKIDGVRVLIADVTWNKGVIHILGEELQ